MRNFVKHNPVKKKSDDLVYLTKDTSSASILSELEEREEITEDIPAPADIPAPTPAPADTLETVEDNLTLQDQESQRGRALEGQPGHLVTFTCNCLKTLSRPGSVDNQYRVELSNVFKSRRH